MQDLKEVTQDVHYENFRAAALGETAPATPRSSKRYSLPLLMILPSYLPSYLPS